MGIELKSTNASGIQAVMSEGLGQSDHAKAAAIPLLRMAALAHDHVDKYFDVHTGFCCISSDAFRRPIDPEAMMCRHVIADRRVLSVSGGSSMGCDALPIKIYLYSACGDPCPQLFLQQLIWYRVIMAANINMVIKARAALLPFGINIWGDGQRL